MKIRLSNQEVQSLLDSPPEIFPKYTTQLMNLANQNAGGTRPRVVGQLSELIQLFQGKTLAEWEAWYLETHPNAIQEATKIMNALSEDIQVSIIYYSKTKDGLVVEYDF